MVEESCTSYMTQNMVYIAIISIWIIKEIINYDVAYWISLLSEFILVKAPKITLELLPSSSKKHEDAVTKDDKEVIKCENPSTLETLGYVKVFRVEDVNEVSAKASKAQKKWCKTSYKERRQVLRSIQAYVVEHCEEICHICSIDSGKPALDAMMGEILTTCEKIRCVNMNGEVWLRKSYRSTGPMMVHKTAYVEYVPFGVLGIIAPWNYPFHNMLNHVTSGIFSGNGLVCKVSEQTSWSSLLFSRIVHEALVVNGHNPDLVQVVTGYAEAGEALVQCADIAKIIFTGSPQVGKYVMSTAAKHLKPVILELGGKDAMVICEDADLGQVFPFAMRGSFQNCGQNCCGVERLLVYESIYDHFVSTLKAKIQALRQGNPSTGTDAAVDCGAMVMARQIDIIQALIDDAVASGATLHCGGHKPKATTQEQGQFYPPTLLTDVTPTMRIAQEEVFGPVMCIVKVPNDNDEAAIKLVNDCSFGLGSSVFSSNQNRALAIGEQIKSGMFTANDFGVNYLIQSLPFGGINESGFDRFAGPEGLRACCYERSMVVDRFWGIKTTIPKPLDYPINIEKGIPFTVSLIKFFYCESFIEKVKAVFGLIKNG